MTLTAEEIAALIGVVVVLANAFALYLSHQSTGKNIDAVSAKVDVVSQAVAATPPIATIVTTTSSGPAGLIDGHEPVPHG